jgi:glycosyltransferase involved in cell wall biosynthesis
VRYKKRGQDGSGSHPDGYSFHRSAIYPASKAVPEPAPPGMAGRPSIRPYNFDIWHSWHYVDDYTEPIIARLSGTKHWVYTKKNMSWGSRAWLLRSLLATRIAADNTEMQAAFFNRLGLSKKVRLIHHGIPPDQFSPDVPPTLGLRDKLGIPQGAVVVGCVANLTIRKGHHVLLEALAKIPGVYLITIGKPIEPEYASRLEKMRQDLQLQDRVYLQGYVEDVPAFLAEIDIFVLPTWDRGSKEGCPVALVEAMSSGRACIATASPVPGTSLKMA